MTQVNAAKRVISRKIIVFVVIAVSTLPEYVSARNPYHKAFFQAYPTAKGSVLDDVPSHIGHCGVCHYDFGGSPVGHSYADGQYWDDTYYAIPCLADSVEVTLYYQSTSKEFVEFLRDENITNTLGDEIYDLWNSNDKCPPTVMAQTQMVLPPQPKPIGDLTGDCKVDPSDLVFLAAHWLNEPCDSIGNWCNSCDINQSGRVDLGDFADLAQHWLDTF